MTLSPWTQVIRLQSDVEAGEKATAIYAIDLGALVANDPGVPRLYRESRAFFSATHLTSGLHRLLNDVLSGLAGGESDRVLQLRSPFGGGKSHTLAALYHAAKDRAALNGLPEAAGLPDPGPVRIAVFDGEKFDVNGREINGQNVQTMWGNLAAQLGCFDHVATHDRDRIAPGGDVIARMLGKGAANPPATLILLDEVLKYIERASAKTTGDSTLGRQTQEFLHNLSVEAAGTPRVVMVYSLQASASEAYGNEPLLDMLDHLTSRVDAKREPVSGDEILPVLRRRLLAETPESVATQAVVAEAMSTEVTRMKMAHAPDESARRDAEHDRLALKDRFAAAYPFHPALIDIMRERWASLPHFQRTRGALRFLAVCLYVLKRENSAGLLLSPGDIPLSNGDVAQAFFTEVGQREPFKAVLERDFFGTNARVPRIDERLARENPRLTNVHPAQRIATAILMYSFGGLSRPGEPGGEAVATGVSESELLSTIVTPELDSITTQAVLKDLREQCLYLHFDGVRYVFRTTPNITQTLEQEAEHIHREEIDQAIQDDLDNRLRGRNGAILWPLTSAGIPDREPRFLLAYLPLDSALEVDSIQEALATDYFTKHGETPRRHRNGLGLAFPDRNQVNPLRRAMKYRKAIERVRGKRAALNLTTAQLDQLKDRENNEKTAFESAMRSLYQSVWLPARIEGNRVEIEKVNLSGRALSAQGLHERLMELLAIPPKRVFDSITSDKLLELLRLGAGSTLALRTEQIIEQFYGVPGFPRLDSESAIRRAIAAGVQEGKIGYVGRASQVNWDATREAESAYLVDSANVRRSGLSADDVDTTGGVIILPEAIRPEAPVAPAGTPVSSIPTASTLATSTQPEPAQPEPARYDARRTHLRLSMNMSRQQLFAAWNAFKNLADAVGNIRLTLEAHKADGFDPTWLRNALYEPLDEADIEVDES